jgi:two-component system, chemotaxis family, protein-glutamate methylesterase/glutaminase
MMEERKNLLGRMEAQTRQRGFNRFANDHKQKGVELQLHINKLKELLTITQTSEHGN